MSFFPATHNLVLYSGDTLAFTVTYQEGPLGSEVGRDLTGATITADIAVSAGAASVTSLVVTPDADQESNPGLMAVSLPAANSDLLTGTSYVYDIQVEWPDESIQTIIRGSIAVTKDVT